MIRFYATILLGFFSTATTGYSFSENAETLFLRETAHTELRMRLNGAFEQMKVSAGRGETQSSSEPKSVAKGVLFSAMVPGSGQIYAGSYLKGAAFLLVEAAAIFGQIHFNKEGNNYEDQFETLANAEWSEDAYWDWIAQVSTRDRSDLAALRDWERDNFSHFLPEQKNQQYYENVGKYNQFIMGWRDFREELLNEPFTFEIYRSGNLNGVDLRTISPTRNDYTQIRKDSNDNFKRASTLATITLLNHVFSAIDAGWTTKRHNRRLNASAQLQGIHYGNQIIPALVVGVSW